MYAHVLGQTVREYKLHGPDGVGTWYGSRVVDGRNDDELQELEDDAMLEVVEELTREIRRWSAESLPRRGVRFLVRFVWSGLIDREIYTRTRDELATCVLEIGRVGSWYPCDVFPVVGAIRCGRWSEFHDAMEWPLCSSCQMLQDVLSMKADAPWFRV